MKYIYLFQHLDIVGDDLEVDYSIFEDLIWPKIAMRVPGFDNLKVKTVTASNSCHTVYFTCRFKVHGQVTMTTTLETRMLSSVLIQTFLIWYT